MSQITPLTTYSLITEYYNEVTITYLVVNLIANIWNMIIFTRKKFKHSFGFYAFWLSIADIIASFGSLFKLLEKEDIFLNKNSFICRIGQYAMNTLEYFSSWILVLAAIDLTISLKNPALHQKMSKKMTRRAIIGSIFAFFLLPEIGQLVYPVYNCYGPTYCYCQSIDDSMELKMRALSDAFGISLKAAIPFVIMMIANILSSCFVYQSKKKLNIKQPNKLKRFAGILIGLNVLFLVCKLPYEVVSSILDFRLAATDGIVQIGEVAYYKAIADATDALHIVKFLYPILQVLFYLGFNRLYLNTSFEIVKNIVSKS